jgi:hypothetical protein
VVASVILAVAFVVAQAGAPAAPPRVPDTPAVSAAGNARPHTDMAGSWAYNDDESVNAATGRPESARAVNERRGFRGGGPTGGGGTGGGGRGTGATGRPRDAGGFGGGSSAPQETLYNLYIMQRDTQRDLMEIAPRLSFDIKSASVTITDDLDRVLTFPTDGRKHHYQLGAAVFDARVTWDGGQLKMDIEGPDGLKIAETYFLSEDGSRLFLIIRIGGLNRDGRPVGVNRVYNRVN